MAWFSITEILQTKKPETLQFLHSISFADKPLLKLLEIDFWKSLIWLNFDYSSRAIGDYVILYLKYVRLDDLKLNNLSDFSKLLLGDWKIKAKLTCS